MRLEADNGDASLKTNSVARYTLLCHTLPGQESREDGPAFKATDHRQGHTPPAPHGARGQVHRIGDGLLGHHIWMYHSKRDRDHRAAQQHRRAGPEDPTPSGGLWEGYFN